MIPAPIYILPAQKAFQQNAMVVKPVFFPFNLLSPSKRDSAFPGIVFFFAVFQPSLMHCSICVHIAGITIQCAPACGHQFPCFRVIVILVPHTILRAVLPACVLDTCAIVQRIPPAIDLVPALVGIAACAKIIPLPGLVRFPARCKAAVALHIPHASVYNMPSLRQQTSIFFIIVPADVLTLGLFLESNQLFSCRFVKMIPTPIYILPAQKLGISLFSIRDRRKKKQAAQ